VNVDYGIYVYTLYGIRGLNVVRLQVRPSDTIQSNVKILKYIAYARIVEQVDPFYNRIMGLISAFVTHKRQTAKTETSVFRGFSPQANYTDRATAACLRS
jgi:hypothetical protein